jgi:hypothetical protein
MMPALARPQLRKRICEGEILQAADAMDLAQMHRNCSKYCAVGTTAAIKMR